MNPTFLQSARSVDNFDFVEVTIRLHSPVDDPFRTVRVTGAFGRPGEEALQIVGFCDSQDGSVHRIRFMPVLEGKYDYTVGVEWPNGTASTSGMFEAGSAYRKGLLIVDEEYPYHFLWSGTSEHFFWNATTAYFMPGCSDAVMADSIDRLASKEINRIRTALNSCRVANGEAWREAVYPDEEFTFIYGPWLAKHPEAAGDPSWDVTRFDVSYWQKFERLVARARERDIIVSVIFYIDGYRPGAYPFDMSKTSDHYGLDEDEVRYYQYAVSRLAAYANVEWCITNEWHIFRPKTWVRAIGKRLSAMDPYGHLMSVHGDEEFSFRLEDWGEPFADFAAYQAWDEKGGYEFMMENRRLTERSKRLIPQVNEEYCYEAHIPDKREKSFRSADSRRRIAWEISMAGCYQSTGESTKNGLGGWLNGRGNESMTMLNLYAIMKNFFESFPWWRLNPHPELAEGAMCLAEPGVRYLVYLPDGAPEPKLSTEPGDYSRRWFNPRCGSYATSPDDQGDWVLLVERQE